MANKPKFQIFKGADDQFYFRLKAGNGEIILQSEGYTAKASAKKTIENNRKTGQDDQNYDRKKASDGSPYFNLVAANGQVIGTSEMYSSAAARDKGIEAVKKAIGVAIIEDLVERKKPEPAFELFKGSDKQFYFRLEAPNGQVILMSEGYQKRASAENGIDSVKNNGDKIQMFEKLTSKDGQYYFNLKATNGQVIGTSETYKTAAGRDNGVLSVIKNAPKAKTKDLTA